MIVYQVNCLVDQGINQAFLAWLKLHVDEVIALEGFTGVEISTLIEDDRMAEYGKPCAGFSVRYQLDSRAALDNYLNHHHPVFWQDGLDRFGGQFKAYRRVLKL